MSKKVRAKMIAHSRAGWGCTVSFSTDAGLTHTVHRRAATTQKALLECIREIDMRADDGPWYVEVISTPQTIYDDMQGTISQRGDHHSRERQYLAKVGRKDLLRVPDIKPPADSSQRPGHAWRRLYSRGGGVKRT